MMNLKFLLALLLISIFEPSSSMSLSTFLMDPLAAISENHKILPIDERTNLIQPDFIQISFRKLRNDDELLSGDGDNESRQIPVISDIERIKKVIEIIEFVGDKVGDLIDKIAVPSIEPDESQQQPFNFRNTDTSASNTSTVNSQENSQ